VEDFFIFEKKVDKSALFQGMAISTRFQNVFYEKIGFRLSRGESKMITILLDGVSYQVKLVNQAFNQEMYPEHQDMLQLRYDGNKELIETMRSRFSNTWNRLKEYYDKFNAYKGFSVPKGEEEYISIFATPVKGSLYMECLPTREYKEGIKEIRQMDELTFEMGMDENAGIEERYGIRKIRHLSKAIGNSLKVEYGYRCQICGEYIGERYGSNLIHAHHIEYFTQSLNNNADNILVVCPNHHGIIHDMNPRFDRMEKVYCYPNGLKEGLKLNVHIS